MPEIQFNQFEKPIAFWNRTNFATSNIPVANVDVKADSFTPTEVKPKKLSKLAKWGIALGSIAVVIGGAIIGIRANYAKIAQKTFKEVFMRDDITKKEALEIIKRYKKIEKIQDKEEYVKALFEEVKRNYGLGETNIKLTMLENNLQGKSVPTSNAFNKTVNMPLSYPRDEIFASMHHEFRHSKQHDIAFSLSPIEYMRKCYGTPSNEEVQKVTKAIQDILKDSEFKSIKQLTNGLSISDYILETRAEEYITNFTNSTLTQKQKILAEKLLNAKHVSAPDLSSKNFFKFVKDSYKHLTSTAELDAYKAEYKMAWLFKFMPSNLS